MLVSGTLVLIDRHISELAVSVYDAMLASNAPELDVGSDAALFLHMVKGFLSSLQFPSAFLLQTEDGSQVVGTLKEDGLEEPISAYYFKHGAAGLSQVHLIGIKEVPTPSVTLPDTQMLGAGQQVAQSLSDMLFPPEAMRVTPIAMFRKL